MKRSTKRNEPLVSVIMPVYNGSEFVGEAIESILNQSYKNLELIVVDDGSKDNTKFILERFVRSYPHRLKIISYERNKGESAAANIGFAASKGEFIARMDADDISYPDRIKKQVAFMLSRPKVIVSGTQADIVDENGRIVGKKTFPLSHEAIYKTYGVYHPMLHPSCMFRRAALPRKKRLWEDTHEPNDDYYTLFGLLRFGEFANLSQKLVGYRMHSNNKSLQQVRKKVFHALKIRCDAVRYFGYRPSILAVFINFLELFGALILPERLILRGYFFCRGITLSPKIVINPLRKLSWSLLHTLSLAS